MKRIADVINEPGGTERLVDAGIVEVEAELSERKGPSNAATKLGYQGMNKIRPGFVKAVATGLMPDMATAIDPHLDAADGAGTPLPTYFASNDSAIADAMLAVVDKKAENANNATAKKAYGKMRPKAKDNVIGALPRVAKLLERELA